MPHKRKPYWARERQKDVGILVSKEDIVSGNLAMVDDRDNIISKMEDSAIIEARTIIEQRWETARETTDEIAEKMYKWEKQYNAEFLTEVQDDDGQDTRIYLGKTREQVNIVAAYLQTLVSQIEPLVTFIPAVSSINQAGEEFKRAKVKEALMEFYFNNVWKIKEDLFPKWLKTFLKFPLAVWKVTYLEDDALPDLRLEVVDRSMLYIDPVAHDIKDARWVLERYYLPKSEVLQRIESGYWTMADDQNIVTVGLGNLPVNIMERYYGKNLQDRFSIEEDDMVEIWDYWQAPIKGLDDVYAVIVGGQGGQLARYGRNPFPYKGLPYRGKSFNPHEYHPDGSGLVEEYRPVQEVVNNFLNMRITDVRENIISPVAVPGNFVDKQTQEDFKNGKKLIRLSEEVMEAAKDPGFDLRRHFVELPIRTSTGELFNDLAFILGQGKETTNISDVFRGQNPQSGATLGQIQEQLGRNQGVFRPVYIQIMRAFEEVAEICDKYFSSPEFFPTERIIQIVGKNKYKDIIDGWHTVGNNISVRSVSADEMDVNVMIDAVNGADAIASRTFLITSLEQIIHSIGQIPELYQELRTKLDFSQIVELMLNSSGQDIESIRLSDEAIQQRAQQAEQQRQQQIQEQLQMAGLMEQQKQNAIAQGKLGFEQGKSQLDIQEKVFDHQSMMAQIETKVRLDLMAELEKMRQEFLYESRRPDISVGHGNNVNQ